jgi:hypothetical protein
MPTISAQAPLTERRTCLRNFIGKVVLVKGFIFGLLASLQIKMIGIYGRSMVSSGLLASAEHDRYLCLLDQDVHGSNASPITTGHPIHLIHDQAGPGVDIQSRRRIMLSLPQNESLALNQGATRQ